jgi:methionyl-tRNA formyltransferase
MNLLVGVAILKKNDKTLGSELKALNLGVEILALERKDWIEILSQKLTEIEADTVWVLTFPWKIPLTLLKIPKHGFINFHYGLLPKYKGIDPIFWQYKNKENYGGLTVHLMNEHIDEGPILLQEQVPVMLGETYGFHCLRLGNTTPDWLSDVVDAQNNPQFEYLQLEPANQIIDQKPSEKDLTLDWKSQTAEDIEWLVNACNPKYGGVKTINNNVEMYILEVTPVTMEGLVNADPGQIVHADAIYGLVVCCADKSCVRITIVRTREGYLSGVKLFNLGFGVGHRFE